MAWFFAKIVYLWRWGALE